MLYASFWVIPRRLNFICRHFETLFHLYRQVGTYLPMKMEQTECSETSAYKIQTPENHPEESIQHSEHGESLESRTLYHTCTYVCLPEDEPSGSKHVEDIKIKILN